MAPPHARRWACLAAAVFCAAAFLLPLPHVKAACTKAILDFAQQYGVQDPSGEDGACSADWLAGYTETDFICPPGEYIKDIWDVKQATLNREQGIVQISLTCSGGGSATLPAAPSSRVSGLRSNDAAGTISGWSYVEGRSTCQLSDLSWGVARPPPPPPADGSGGGWQFSCPGATSIQGVRVGSGEFLNSLRFCCGDKAAAQHCPPPPPSWCPKDKGGVLTQTDCDGDGFNDWACYVPAGGGKPASRGLLLSSKLCKPASGGWPSADAKLCPAVFAPFSPTLVNSCHAKGPDSSASGSSLRVGATEDSCGTAGTVDEYREYFLSCPPGAYATHVQEVTGTYGDGWAAVLQVVMTCSDGTTVGPYPPQKPADAGEETSTLDYGPADRGFHAISGSVQRCVVGTLSFDELPAQVPISAGSSPTSSPTGSSNNDGMGGLMPFPFDEPSNEDVRASQEREAAGAYDFKWACPSAAGRVSALRVGAGRASVNTVSVCCSDFAYLTAATDCPRPGPGASEWCPPGSLFFNLDCDQDGHFDWACISGDGAVYATALSSRRCVPKRADEGDTSACRPAFIAAPTATSKCPPVNGYVATPNRDAPDGNLAPLTEYAGGLPFASITGLVSAAAEACWSDLSCKGFNTAGQLKADVAGGGQARSGMCLYVKDPKLNPAGSRGAADCPMPPASVLQSTTSWCGEGTSALFNLDCDGDGARDWACASSGFNFAVALSSRGCKPTKAAGRDFSGCPAAFNALPTATSRCPATPRYYADYEGLDTPIFRTGTIAELVRAPFASLADMVAAAVAACDRDAECKGFNTAGVLRGAIESHPGIYVDREEMCSFGKLPRCLDNAPQRGVDWTSRPDRQLGCDGSYFPGDYNGVDLYCPGGARITRVEMVTGFNVGEQAILQITATCSDGSTTGPLPPGDVAGQRWSFDSSDGFTGVSGAATCQLSYINMIKAGRQADAHAPWSDSCDGTAQRITAVRIGYSGSVVNGMRICCG